MRLSSFLTNKLYRLAVTKANYFIFLLTYQIKNGHQHQWEAKKESNLTKLIHARLTFPSKAAYLLQILSNLATCIQNSISNKSFPSMTYDETHPACYVSADHKSTWAIDLRKPVACIHYRFIYPLTLSLENSKVFLGFYRPWSYMASWEVSLF